MDILELDYLENKKSNKYSSQYYFKKSYIFVNSTKRNKVQSNILDKIIQLQNNPLHFEQFSNFISIFAPKHNFQENDLIILDNVTSNAWSTYYTLEIVNNRLFITETSNLQSIEAVNQLKEVWSENTYIQILNLDGDISVNLSTDRKFILQKIPLNFFTQRHKIEYDSELNKLYINLGVSYTEKPSPIQKYFTIVLKNLCGIPLNEINANFPLDQDHINGNHIIKSIDPDHIIIQVKTAATLTQENGGKNIVVSKVVDNIIAYPSPSFYEFLLDKTYTNVTEMRVISSEIPFTIKNITDTNNVFSWSNKKYSSGTTINEIKFPIGSYTSDEIFDELLTSLNSFSTQLFFVGTIRNFFFKIQCYQVFYEYQPFIEDETSTTTNFSFRKTIRLRLNNHNLNNNDLITIENAISFKGIPASVLNRTFSVLVIDDNTLRIDLGNFNLDNSTINNITFGGNDVVFKILNPIRVEPVNNNIYSNLGIENFSDFVDVVENTKPVTDFVNSYIKLICYTNNIKSNENNSVLTNFRFDGKIRKTLYDTYTPNILTFDPPLKSVSKLLFEFLNVDNTSVDFTDFEHSFVIELLERKNEEVYTPQDKCVKTNKSKFYNSDTLNDR